MSLFQGIGTALATPFTQNNEVNYSVLGDLIEFQIENNIQALFPTGTTGESATLSTEEKLAIIKFTVQQVKGRVPVLAGTGSNNTETSVFLTKESVRLGVDGILAVTPYYNKGNNSGILHYYQGIAESAGLLPVMVYNVPSRTGVHLSIDLLKQIAKHKNITMYKEASGNISYGAEVAYHCPDLALFSGNDDMILPLMSLGGAGAVSVASNIIPDIMQKMAHSFLNGDNKTAAAIQIKYNDFFNAIFIETNPVPIKAALSLKGFNMGHCRSPLGELDHKNLEILKDILQKYGVI